MRSEMLPHQQRVIDEKNELVERITKLKAFFTTEMFVNLGTEDKQLLQRQCIVMQDYAGILEQRISRFSNPQE